MSKITVDKIKGYDQIAAEAAQHAEEAAGELDLKAREIEENTISNTGEMRRRASIAKLAAMHARKCADEARGATQENRPSAARFWAKQAIEDALQAGDMARVFR